MALPQGAFNPGEAGITSPGGAYIYDAQQSFPQYFAGTFFIDTGYDDPVSWTTGVDAAEVYQARVYANTSTISPAVAGGTYLGKWHISPTPTWTGKQWATPHSNSSVQNRIFIQCDVYLSEPVSIQSLSWQRLETVNWSLYRI